MTEGHAPHPEPLRGLPLDSDEEVAETGDLADADAGLDEPSDAALLQAHVEGDPTAFSTLVRRHQDRLWAVALRVTGRPDDAADALQDAYVAAFRRAATYRGEARVTTWLHRVVVNACLDRLRRAKVRAADPLPEDLDRVEVLGREPDADPVEEAERREAVADALATLNPDQRAALVLVDMQGYPVEEAARILGCAPGTVKSRCARGRARLVPLLAPLRGAGGEDGRGDGPGTGRGTERDAPDERQGAPP